MNENSSERVAPMLTPPHLVKLITGRLEHHRDGGSSALGAGHVVALAERQSWSVGKHGVGVGGYRLGHHGSLDEDASES